MRIPKARGRTIVKELCKLAPYLRYKVCLLGEAPSEWSLRGCNKESLPTVIKTQHYANS